MALLISSLYSTLMKYTLLFFSAFITMQSDAQCNLPPPPGVNPIYSVDMNNDGYTSFDIAYYINYVERPNIEEIYGVSSSAYDFVFYNGFNNAIPELLYTNLQFEEYGAIHYDYTGSGQMFSPVAPCYWPVLSEGGIRLVAVPFDGDTDNDGILNVNEDANGNLNLMDDDIDNDGTINLFDPAGSLVLNDDSYFDVKVYPNPVSNGFLTIESDADIVDVTVYDISGRQIFKIIDPVIMRLNMLDAGSYVFKFRSGNKSLCKRIIID